MKNNINDRIELLRQQMNAAQIDAVIIPQTDPHQSEYIADHWQVRRFLSGFTGSAGSLVVTANNALLWADSRYFIQAAQQLEGTSIILMKDGLGDTPSIEQYLIDNLQKGATVGVDGMLFSLNQAQQMKKTFEAHGLNFVTNFDAIDQVWPDRPSLPEDKIFIHEEKYTGESAKDKIKGILDNARQQMAESAFISALDEIAWALNIRSKDVKYNPVVTSYLYVSPHGSTLLVNPEKLTPEINEYLASQGVNVKPYAEVKEFVASIPEKKVLVDEARTSITLYDLLGDRAVKGQSPIAISKGCKNEVQVDGIRKAMERDGAALVRVFMEIEETLQKGETLTELDVDALMLKYRSQQEKFFDESFGSIIGYGPHGAIVHYEPTIESNATIYPNGLLLVDSGAQYFDGTTDITRTVALGEPTEMEKCDFTLVMKGHIALSTAIFPLDTRGAQLDVLARQFLWKAGLSYLHGTGHGVGHFLNVHEGPQSIRLNNTPIPLMPGMITSNEPGLYRENIHGIRCENLVLTVPAMNTEFGEFLKFETLTLFPFDLKLFDLDIMTDEEVEWVNAYHKEVRDRLMPYLNDKEQAWLESKTRDLRLV